MGKKIILFFSCLSLALIMSPLLTNADGSGGVSTEPLASDQKASFFPVSVWYTGGKVRAPMIEKVTPASAATWKKDLEQIKKLGFNTVRCWIEWAYNEKEEGHYDSQP